MSRIPTGKLRRTYSGPPLYSFSKDSVGLMHDIRVNIEDSAPTVASSSSSAAPSIAAESPTSVLSRRLTRHASIETNKIPINLDKKPPEDQEESKEVERLETTVGWLQSEVKALRVHLTLLEIQSANSLRKLKVEGRDTELTPEQTHRVQVLNTLKKELEMELDCIKEYHNLEKVRNDELEETYLRLRRKIEEFGYWKDYLDEDYYHDHDSNRHMSTPAVGYVDHPMWQQPPSSSSYQPSRHSSMRMEDVIDFSEPIEQQQQPKPSRLYRTRSVDREFISDVASEDLNPSYVPRAGMTEPHPKFSSYIPGLDLDHSSSNRYRPTVNHDYRYHPHDDFHGDVYAPTGSQRYDPRDEFRSSNVPSSDTYNPHYEDMKIPSHYIERTPKHSRFSNHVTPHPGYLDPLPNHRPFYDDLSPAPFQSEGQRYREENAYGSMQYESNPTMDSFDGNSSSRDHYYDGSQRYYEETNSPAQSHYIERVPSHRRFKDSSHGIRYDDDVPPPLSSHSRSTYRSPPPPLHRGGHDYASDRYSESLRGSSQDQFDRPSPRSDAYSYHSAMKSQAYGGSDYAQSNSEDGRYTANRASGSGYGQYEDGRHDRRDSIMPYHQYTDQSSQFTEESYRHRRKASSSYEGSETDTKSYIYQQMDQDAKSSSYSQVGNDAKWQMASVGGSRSIGGFDTVGNEDASNADSDRFEEVEESKSKVENYRGNPVELSMEMVKTISDIYRTRADLPWSLISSPQSSTPAQHKTGASAATSSGKKSKRRSISISSLSDISKLGPMGITDMLNALGGNGEDCDLDPYGTTSDLKSDDVGAYSSLHSIESMPDQEETTRRLKRYRALADQLMKVDPKTFNHEERLAFWINIYNCIVMHAFLSYGIPQKHYKRALLMHKATYVVGGMNFSIMAIEYAILRACSYHHTILGLLPETCFKPSDERFACALDRPEPLVTFALCNGTYSSPCLRVYSASNVHHELQIAAREYVQAAIGITKADKVLIPRLLLWYSKDFASDTIGLMHWVGKLLPRAQREAMMALFPKWRCKALKVIQVVPYDWRFRYLLRE